MTILVGGWTSRRWVLRWQGNTIAACAAAAILAASAALTLAVRT